MKKKNSRQQFTRKHSNLLRTEIAALLDRSNLYLQPERKVAYATAIEVANRDLRKTRNNDASSRVFSAMKAVSSFVSLSAKNKTTTSALSNADLLPVGHPSSTKKHAMTASALRHARAQWIAADELVADEARSIVLSAHAAELGSAERAHAFARIAALGPGSVPLTAAVDPYVLASRNNNTLVPIIATLGFGLGGDSKAARSARAKLQLRDKNGRFAEMGGGFLFNLRMPNGIFSGFSGRVVGSSGEGNVEIEVNGHDTIPDGIYALPSLKGETVGAILSKSAIEEANLPENRTKTSIAGDKNTIEMRDLARQDMPTGWEKQPGKAGEPEIFTSADGYFVKKDGDAFTLHRADLTDNSIGEEVARGDSWADVVKGARADQDAYEKVLEAADAADTGAPAAKATIKKPLSQLENALKPGIDYGALTDDDINRMAQEATNEQFKDGVREYIPAGFGKSGYTTGKGDWKEWDEPTGPGTMRLVVDPEKAEAIKKKFFDEQKNILEQQRDAFNAGELSVVPDVHDIQEDDVKGIVAQIQKARNKAQKIRFKYKKKNDRTIEPTNVYRNPKTGNDNVVGLDENGEERTFIAQEMSPPSVKSAPSAQQPAKSWVEGLSDAELEKQLKTEMGRIGDSNPKRIAELLDEKKRRERGGGRGFEKAKTPTQAEQDDASKRITDALERAQKQAEENARGREPGMIYGERRGGKIGQNYDPREKTRNYINPFSGQPTPTEQAPTDELLPENNPNPSGADEKFYMPDGSLNARGIKENEKRAKKKEKDAKDKARYDELINDPDNWTTEKIGYPATQTVDKYIGPRLPEGFPSPVVPPESVRKAKQDELFGRKPSTPEADVVNYTRGEGDPRVEAERTEIENAINARQKLRVSYNGKDRIIEPLDIWTNPKTGKENVRAIDHSDGGKEKNFGLLNIEKPGTPAKEAAPDNSVDLDTSGVSAPLQQQIQDAIDNGKNVKFKYNGKDREVTPSDVWTNPKNGNVNLRTKKADGSYVNYTLDKMENSSGAGKPPTVTPAPSMPEGPDNDQQRLNAVKDVIAADRDSMTPENIDGTFNKIMDTLDDFADDPDLRYQSVGREVQRLRQEILSAEGLPERKAREFIEKFDKFFDDLDTRANEKFGGPKSPPPATVNVAKVVESRANRWARNMSDQELDDRLNTEMAREGGVDEKLVNALKNEKARRDGEFTRADVRWDADNNVYTDADGNELDADQVDSVGLDSSLIDAPEEGILPLEKTSDEYTQPIDYSMQGAYTTSLKFSEVKKKSDGSTDYIFDHDVLSDEGDPEDRLTEGALIVRVYPDNTLEYVISDNRYGGPAYTDNSEDPMDFFDNQDMFDFASDQIVKNGGPRLTEELVYGNRSGEEKLSSSAEKIKKAFEELFVFPYGDRNREAKAKLIKALSQAVEDGELSSEDYDKYVEMLTKRPEDITDDGEAEAFRKFMSDFNFTRLTPSPLRPMKEEPRDASDDDDNGSAYVRSRNETSKGDGVQVAFALADFFDDPEEFDDMVKKINDLGGYIEVADTPELKKKFSELGGSTALGDEYPMIVTFNKSRLSDEEARSFLGTDEEDGALNARFGEGDEEYDDLFDSLTGGSADEYTQPIDYSMQGAYTTSLKFSEVKKKSDGSTDYIFDHDVLSDEGDPEDRLTEGALIVRVYPDNTLEYVISDNRYGGPAYTDNSEDPMDFFDNQDMFDFASDQIVKNGGPRLTEELVYGRSQPQLSRSDVRWDADNNVYTDADGNELDADQVDSVGLDSSLIDAPEEGILPLNEANAPSPVGPSGNMPDFLEQEFDSMFEIPDGAYKPNIFELYTPQGRKEGDSAEYTDDPAILANLFDPDELIVALNDAVMPKSGNEASGYGNLDFRNGDEQVKAEAIYSALELRGIDAANVLAKIYDTGLENTGGKTNAERLAENDSAIPSLDVAPPDKLPKSSPMTEEKRIRELNREASLPSNAQVILENMSDFVETNQNLYKIKDEILRSGEFGFYDPDAFPDMFNDHLDLAYGTPEEKQAFAGFWGMLISLDGNATLASETNSTFRGVIYRAIAAKFGDDRADEEYLKFVQEFGGFKEFALDKLAIARGDEGLDSGTVGASFMRLMKIASSPNKIELQRSFSISRYNDELLGQYTSEGGIISLDPRPFSEADYVGDTSFIGANTWASEDLADHRIILVAAPGELDSVSAVGLSWYDGEQEHLAHGTFEITKVTRRKSGDDRRADEFVVELKRSDSSVEDIAAEELPAGEAAEAFNIPQREILDVSNWKKVANKTSGSNEGAFYEDENGQGYYVKVPKSESHADNETLASVFYDALGTPSAEVSKGDMNGELRVVSKLIPGATQDLGDQVDAGNEEYLDKLRADFAVDAWLSNWDVTGTGFDNVMSDDNGNPVRVDPGGALMWRAQGAPKGSAFGNEVTELDTLRDEDRNWYSASVFGSMTDDDVKESAKKLIPMTPDRIDAIVDSIVTNPDDAALIKERLKNRRQNILDRFGLSEEAKPGEPVSLGERMGFKTTDLEPGDVTSDSFVIERVFSDETTPKGKVSVEGYYPGRETQRKEWGPDTVIDVARGVSAPPKGNGAALHKPKKPWNPTPPAFTGDFAKQLEGAQSWAEVRDILNGRDLIAFDYETTGFNAGNNNMPVQLGAVRIRDGKVVDRFNVFMDPMEDLSDWSRENLKDIDGNPLTDEFLAQQIGMGEAHSMFAEWAGADSVLVAHNTPFDKEILDRITSNENVDFTPAGYIDTLRLGRDLLPKKSKANPDGVEGHTLQKLLDHYDIELNDWHTADADAEGTANLLQALVGDAADRPDVDPTTLDFAGQANDFEQAQAAFTDAENAYKDALAKYNMDKAVAAAWHCGFTAAAGDDDEDNTCNVPSVDDLIESSTVKPGELTDPDAVTSGDPSSDENPFDLDSDGTEEPVTDKYPVSGESYPPTPQQQAVIDTFLDNEGDDIVVRAAAGAGKTSTLLALARRIQKYQPKKRIIYIAFNRSVADEARDKMPSNVEVRTADSISYAWVGQNFPKLMDKYGSKTALTYPKDVVNHLGIPEIKTIDEDGKVVSMTPKQRASVVRKAIYNFTISDDKELGPQHFEMSPDDVTPALLASAQRWWDDTKSPTGQMPFGFNHMKKLWSLSNPDLNSTSSGLKEGADVVFVDEFQDTNDVLGSVVSSQQNTQNVYVGDQNQAIYQFMGANDWLQKVDTEHDLPLTQSFRFGENIANIANKFLRFKEEHLKAPKTFRVEGAGKNPGKIVERGSMEDADVVLVRSNAGAFGAVREELDRGRTVGVTKGFKKDLDDFISGIKWLQANPTTRGSRPSKMPEELQQFATWAEVLEEAASGADAELSSKAKILIKDVEDIGVAGLEDLSKRIKVINGAGNKKDFGGHPDLPDDLSPGVTGELGRDVTFEVRDDKIVLDGKTFDVKDVIKKSNGGNATWDKELGKWVVPVKTDAARKNALEKLQSLINGDGEPTGSVDVVVTTVHQAKGLEWGKVRIGNDFWGPRQNKDNPDEWIFPSEPEIHLAYVAVTRAESELDMGALDWVNDWISDVEEPNIPQVAEEVNLPEEVSAPEAPEAPEEINLPEEPTAPEEPSAPEEDITAPEEPGAPEAAPEQEKFVWKEGSEGPGSAVREADLAKALEGADEAIADTIDPENTIVKGSNKKAITEARDELKEIREGLANGTISEEEAISRLNEIIDSIPEISNSKPEEQDYVETVRDYLIDVRSILSGSFYDRPTGPNLPPADVNKGYSRDGIFLLPGARVRDKWGFLGTMLRYNKADWGYVYFKRDIDGKAFQKNTRTLTTVGDNDNQQWIYSPDVPPGKRPAGWESMVTPEEMAAADKAAADKAAAKKAAAKAAGKPAAGTTEALEQNVEEKAKEAEDDFPKDKAPSGAPEATESAVSKIKAKIKEQKKSTTDKALIATYKEAFAADSDAAEAVKRYVSTSAGTNIVTASLASNNEDEKNKYVNSVKSKGQSAIDEVIEEAKTAEALTDAIENSPRLEQETLLYRAVKNAQGLQIVNLEVGEEFTAQGFSSTSIDKGKAEFIFNSSDENKAIIVMAAPPGTKGLYIDARNEKDKMREFEFLLQRGTKFRIVGRDKTDSAYGKIDRVFVEIVAQETPNAIDTSAFEVSAGLTMLDEEDVDATPIDPDWQLKPFPDIDDEDEYYTSTLEKYKKIIEKILGPDGKSSPVFKQARNTLSSYMSDGYGDLNTFLRDPEAADAHFEKFHTDSYHVENAKLLDMLIYDLPPLEEDLVVARGIGGLFSKEFFESHEVGDLFTDNGFVSTSRNPAAADTFVVDTPYAEGGGVSLTILLPAGTRAISASAALGHPAEGFEAEVLLARGTTFRIISKTETEGGLLREVRMAVVSQPEPDSLPSNKDIKPVTNIAAYQDNLTVAYDEALAEESYAENAELIRQYQEDSELWVATNAILRGTKTTEDLEADGISASEVDDMTRALDEEIDKVPGLLRGTLLYRGTRSRTAEKLFALNLGDTYTDDGFTSTSLEQDAAEMFSNTGSGGEGGGVVLEIETPQGTKAISLAAYFGDGLDSESEVIIARGTEFKVLSKTQAKNGKPRKMRVAVVGQTPREDLKKTEVPAKETKEEAPAEEVNVEAPTEEKPAKLPDFTDPETFANPELYKEVRLSKSVGTDKRHKYTTISSEKDMARLDEIVAEGGNIYYHDLRFGMDSSIFPESLKYDPETKKWMIVDMYEDDNPIDLLYVRPIENIVDLLETQSWETGTADNSLFRMYSQEAGDLWTTVVSDLFKLTGSRRYRDAGEYMARVVNELRRQRDSILQYDDMGYAVERYDRYIKDVIRRYKPSSKEGFFNDLFPNQKNRTQEYAAGWDEVLKVDPDAITGTGKAEVRIANPKRIDQSSFEGVESLMGAVSKVINKETDDLGMSAAIDSGDVEDFQVRATTVVNADTGEKKLRLRFKLTAWRASEIVTEIDEEADQYGQKSTVNGVDWTIEENIGYHRTAINANGDIIEFSDYVEHDDLSVKEFQDSRTLKASTEVSTGSAEIKFLRANTDDSLSGTGWGARALHNAVTIDLPLDATMEDIEHALRIAGVKNPRATEPEDVVVLAENRLMSIFKGQTDPTKNVSDPDRRTKMMNDIAYEWDVTPEEVEMTTDSTGFITFLLPEATAQKITNATNNYVLQHNMNLVRVDEFVAAKEKEKEKSVGFMSFDERREKSIKVIVDTLMESIGLKATTNRFSEGMSVSGMSTGEDSRTGGAEYVFLRPTTRTEVKKSVHGSNDLITYIFHPIKAFRRADFFANPYDKFGARSSADDFISNAMAGKNQSAEIMFKNSLSMQTALGIVMSDENRRAVLQELERRGVTEIAGIPVEQFVTVHFDERLLDTANGTNSRPVSSMVDDWLDDIAIGTKDVDSFIFRLVLSELKRDVPAFKPTYVDPTGDKAMEKMGTTVVPSIIGFSVGEEEGSWPSYIVRNNENGQYYKVQGHSMTHDEPIVAPLSDGELNDMHKSMISNHDFFIDATEYLDKDIFKMPGEYGVEKYMAVGNYGTTALTVARLKKYEQMFSEGNISAKQLANYTSKSALIPSGVGSIEDIMPVMVAILANNKEVRTALYRIMHPDKLGDPEEQLKMWSV